MYSESTGVHQHFEGRVNTEVYFKQTERIGNIPLQHLTTGEFVDVHCTSKKLKAWGISS